MNKTLDLAFRTIVRGSDGLRTLVVAPVAPQAFAGWLAVNEGRQGAPDYVQVDLRSPSTSVRSVVVPLDLALRLARLGLELDPQKLKVSNKELFEVALDYMRQRGAGAQGAAAPRK